MGIPKGLKAFPTWRYHKDKPPRLCRSADDVAAAEKDGFADSPEAFRNKRTGELPEVQTHTVSTPGGHVGPGLSQKGVLDGIESKDWMDAVKAIRALEPGNAHEIPPARIREMNRNGGPRKSVLQAFNEAEAGFAQDDDEEAVV